MLHTGGLVHRRPVTARVPARTSRDIPMSGTQRARHRWESRLRLCGHVLVALLVLIVLLRLLCPTCSVNTRWIPSTRSRGIAPDAEEKLRSKNYFIALNLYNNERVLPFLLPKLKELIFTLNSYSNVFLSIYENGISCRLLMLTVRVGR